MVIGDSGSRHLNCYGFHAFDGLFLGAVGCQPRRFWSNGFIVKANKMGSNQIYSISMYILYIYIKI